jgi:hypothetical protein
MVNGIAGWANGGLMANGAARALKFRWIRSSDDAVVVEIVKRLMDAGEALSICESQKLIFTETVSLVDLDLCRSRGNQEHGE